MKISTQNFNGHGVFRDFLFSPGVIGMVCILFLGFGSASLLLGDNAARDDKNLKKPVPEEKQKEKTKTTEEIGSVTGSMTGAFIEGDKAQFMRRYRTMKDFSGGIEDFFIEQTVKDVTTHIEGWSLFDAHDYRFKLGVEKEKVGHFDIGYKQFRTWYDGSGGFFPQNGQWFSLYDEQFSIDRGEAWFEGALTLPDLPILGFKYMYEFREGKKDSLLWGDSNLTGGQGVRNIVPSFRKINERRDIFEGTLKHTVDETTFNMGLRYETTADNNALYVRRRPLEGTDRMITTREIQTSDLFSFHGSTETWFSEKLLFATGYSLTTLDTDIGGSFIYGGAYDAPFNARFAGKQANDNGFIDLNGGSQGKEATVAMNLMTIPLNDLTLTLGVRINQQDVDGVSAYTLTSSAAAGGTTVQTPRSLRNDTDFLNVSESMEARYKGIRDWVFYARGGWEQGDGEITEDWRRPDTGAIDIHRDTNVNRFNQKYTTGANWYPLKQLNFGAQYYHKINSSSYVHRNDNTDNNSGNAYPGFITGHDFVTDGANLRMTWRPLNNVTSVTRYDFQESIIDTAVGRINLGGGQSGRTTRNSLGETVTWNPIPRLYLQGSANYVLGRTETPVSGFTGSVLESKNDYLNLGLASGFALNEKTDLQAQYSYYRADNYYDNSLAGLPFGSGAEDHGVTLTLLRRISDAIHWSVKYGFFTHRDDLSGGFNNYDAHVVYTSLRVAF